MASDRRQMPHRRGPALRIPLLALAAAALVLAALGASASAEVVYDNASSSPATVPSLGFAETGTAELGSLVQLAGPARLDPAVQAGITNSGEAVSAPITLSVYATAPGLGPGTLLARDTESFEFAAGSAVQPVAFIFPGLTLPDEAIVSVAFDSPSLGLALAGPPAAGANRREAEGVYRAAAAAGEGEGEGEGEAGAPAPFAFEAAPLAWQGRQPAFAIEADPAPVVTPAPAAPAPAPVVTPTTTRFGHREYTVPPSKRMSVSFPRAIARIAGPGALVQVKCSGSSAARCVGTLSLSAAGTVHKAPYSIGKGRRQYVVVPLGSDLGLLDGLDAPRATATASTVQVGGAAVKTKRALKLK